MQDRGGEDEGAALFSHMHFLGCDQLLLLATFCRAQQVWAARDQLRLCMFCCTVSWMVVLCNIRYLLRKGNVISGGAQVTVESFQNSDAGF